MKKKISRVEIFNGSSFIQRHDQETTAANSFSFVNDDHGFASSWNNKVLRLEECGRLVIILNSPEPTANSVPVTMLHLNRIPLSCQRMRNTTLAFTACREFIPNTKLMISGHFVASYTCGTETSPDCSHLMIVNGLDRTFLGLESHPQIPSSWSTQNSLHWRWLTPIQVFFYCNIVYLGWHDGAAVSLTVLKSAFYIQI